MTKEEFNLSEKVRYCYRICRTKNTRSGSMQKIIKAEDVKEFIKRFKKSKEKIKKFVHYKANNLDYQVGMIHGFEAAIDFLDKLAGEKLI